MPETPWKIFSSIYILDRPCVKGVYRVLTEKQKEAVRLLCIEGKKVQDAAAILGVHRCTIWRWSQAKDFQKEWDRQLKDFIRKWRKESGQTRERAARKRKLKTLYKKMTSLEVIDGDTRALDRAYKEWRDLLFNGIDKPLKSPKNGL